MNKTKVIFYFPYNYPSGVSQLFLRIAEYISELNDFEVSVIDLKNGFMTKNLKKEKLVKKIVLLRNKNIYLEPDSIIIMQSTLPFTIYKEVKFHNNNRFFFWNLYPYSFIQDMVPKLVTTNLFVNNINFYKKIHRLIRPIQYSNLKSFMVSLEEKKALMFQDTFSMELVREFYDLSSKSFDILPVPVDNISFRKSKVLGSPLNVCWIGRLHKFKIYVLLYCLEKIKEYAESKEFEIIFHIIGNGPCEHFLNTNEESSYFKIKRIGDINPLEIDNYLLQNIDLLMAMGTSALEGAKVGIPTILLDFTFSKITQSYKFKWLYNSPTGDIGHLISEKDFKDGKEIEEIIAELLERYESISQECYEFCKKNYDLNKVVKDLQYYIKSSCLLYKDLNKNITKKSMFRKIYENYFREY